MSGKFDGHEKKYDIPDANDGSLSIRINVDVLNEALSVGCPMYAKTC